jgi:hypothetical protein
MNCRDMEEWMDFLRGNQVAPGGADASNRVESPAYSETRPGVQGNRGEKDGLSKEREEELEQWMEQVKAFIREIDTTKL